MSERKMAGHWAGQWDQQMAGTRAEYWADWMVDRTAAWTADYWVRCWAHRWVGQTGTHWAADSVAWTAAARDRSWAAPMEG